MRDTPDHPAGESSLSPFRHRTFAVMWCAALVSNIGTWMHSVGASWLMTSLSPSPLIVSLVQTATTLPIFLFALPAGALADIFSRRSLLLITNSLMLLAAAVFAVMVLNGQTTTTQLLLFTFLLGTGAAFVAPAWQAVIPSMVPKSDLPQAVTLGGISINISRAIGPALAGLLISLYGIAAPFIANAVSFIAIIGAVAWWKYQLPSTGHHPLPPERVYSAIKAGARYARHSTPLKYTMLHVLGFMFFANAYWGLLPVISRSQLQGDAPFFGMLMGAVGVGAVAGAIGLPAIMRRISANQIAALATVGVALVMGYFAITGSRTLALLTSLIFGVSWVWMVSVVNLSAQQALPDWVRARGLAVHLMVMFGAMGLGAAFWGWLAGITSIETAMLCAAAGSLAFAAFAYRYELQQGRRLDLTPSYHWHEPVTHDAVHNDSGPVVVQVVYQIDDADRDAFLSAMQMLKQARKRDGAVRWGIYEDTEHKGRFIEFFTEESWAEHLRHHDRVTHADKPLQEAVEAFHKGATPPVVSHLLAARPTRRKRP